MIFSTIRVSKNHRLHSACHGDAPDILEPPCHSLHLCSMLHNLQPKNVGLSSVCATLGTPAEDDEMCAPSASLPTDSHFAVAGILYECAHGLCSLHISVCEHLHCCISGSASRGNASGYHRSTLDNDISSPRLHDSSTYWLYVLCVDSSPCDNGKHFNRN